MPIFITGLNVYFFKDLFFSMYSTEINYNLGGVCGLVFRLLFFGWVFFSPNLSVVTVGFKTLGVFFLLADHLLYTGNQAVQYTM